MELPYQQYFEAMPCYLSVQDRDFRIIQANRRFRNDFGDFEGRYCYQVYKHRSEKCEVCPVDRTFRDGQSHGSEEVVKALLRFLEDVDETVRFQTVGALAKHGNEIAREPMLKALCEDESIRVKNEIVEAFSRLEWSTSGFKKKIDGLLPSGFKQDKSGKIVKLGSS